FALNVNTDLSLFDTIIPCGLSERGVASVSRLLGERLPPDEVAGRIAAEWPGVFRSRLVEVPRQEWVMAIRGSSSSAITASRKTRTSVGSHCEPAPSSRMRAASGAE